jgi:hypothetical protein
VFEATGNDIAAENGAPAQAPPQQPLNVIQQIQQAAHNTVTPGNNIPQAVVPVQAKMVWRWYRSGKKGSKVVKMSGDGMELVVQSQNSIVLVRKKYQHVNYVIYLEDGI